jgi:hypothetical protein
LRIVRDLLVGDLAAVDADQDPARQVDAYDRLAGESCAAKMTESAVTAKWGENRLTGGLGLIRL